MSSRRWETGSIGADPFADLTVATVWAELASASLVLFWGRSEKVLQTNERMHGMFENRSEPNHAGLDMCTVDSCRSHAANGTMQERADPA